MKIRTFAARAKALSRIVGAATIGLALVVLLAWAASPASAQTWSDLGTDILDDYGITEAEVAGISDGFGDGTWRPYAGMTRAQFVKMAVDRFGLVLINPVSPSFQDIPTTHQYFRYIETAYRAGMIVGIGDGYFARTRTISRAEGAAIIVRYVADQQGTTTEDLFSRTEIQNVLAPFQESLGTIGESLADEMAAAVEWGIVHGTADNRLNPRELLRRIQGAAMLLRADILEQRDVQVTVYFSRDGEVAPVHRTVTVGPSLEVGAAAMEQLLAGPTQAESDVGMITEIPGAAQLVDLSISNGVATVNLDSDFPIGGDAASLKMRLAQVVYTLTAFRSVDSVLFEVAGEPLTELGGISLSQPVGRPGGIDELFEDITPAILVESPTVLDEISSAVRIRGTANVFEAVFQLEILDANDSLLAQEVVMASSGTGDRGTFDVTVPFSQPQTPDGELVVFSESAQDGSRIDVINIPVTFGQ